ncbi:hypothetical protein AB4Y89_09755 [Terriglobus sp. 2YAB30_2]|uniref:hypothetical protein n=1 Tax=unclassified Terriglobus TaxID=2628988 RepID=UPI003F96BD44
MLAAKSPNRLSLRPWGWGVTAILLLAAHGLGFYFLRHLALSATLVSGLIVLAVVKHLGILRSLYAMLRRRSSKTGYPGKGRLQEDRYK